MTHCLDCGAERITDQCPSCGLTSAAAEVMLRRRLLRRTAVFLVGSLAFPYISQIYPPLDLDLMLVFYGAIFFLEIGRAPSELQSLAYLVCRLLLEKKK